MTDLERQTMLRFPNVFVGEVEGHDSPRPPDDFSPRPFNSRRASFVTSEQPTTTDSSIAFLAAQKRNSMTSFNRAATQHRRVSLSIVEQVADTLHENMMSEVVAKQEIKNRQNLLAPNNNAKQRIDGGLRTSFIPVPPPMEIPSTSYLTGDSLMLTPRPEQQQPQAIQQRQDQAMHRAVVAQMQQRDERQANVNETNMKIAAATARKTFLENQRKAQRWATWAAIVSLSLLQRCVDGAVSHGRLVRKSRRMIVPSVFVALRRSLRRARLRLTSVELVKPSPQALRRVDKLLALYSDDHLEWFIDTLKPKYFFEQESIIFSGIEEDEMYVLISGSCDVTVGTKHVFTVTPGMTFGTVGMLTGEPRSARIVARTQNVFVWSGKRRDFESFSRGGPDATQQFQAAMTAINEMRTKNIRNVYKAMLEPSFILTKYSSTFAGISKDFVVQLTTRGLPRIARAGDVLLYTPATSPQDADAQHHHHSPSSGLNVKRRLCGLVFRGRVRVSIPVSAIPMLALLVRQGDPGNSVHMSSSTIISDLDEPDAVLRLLAEAMSSVIELPKQRNASGIVGSLLLGASLNASGRMYGDAPLIPVASTGDGSFASSTNEFVVAAREFVTKHFRRPGASTDGQATAAANHNSNSQQQQQRTFVDPINPGVVFAVVAEFNGPMLLGLPSAILPSDPMLVPPASLLRVDVPAGCDAVVWEHQVIQESDMIEQLAIRQNCLNLRTPFLPELTSGHLIRLLFRGSLAFDFLSRLQHHHPTPLLVTLERPDHSPNTAKHNAAHHQRHNKSHFVPALLGAPWVYPPHHSLSFGESTGWEFFLILRGSITIDSDLGTNGRKQQGSEGKTVLSTRTHVDDTEHVPFMWPETEMVFFGCTPISATTGTVPVDALRISRGDFVAWLLCGLSEGNLKTLVPAVTESFVSKTGRRPIWPNDGLQTSKMWASSTCEAEQQHVGRLMRQKQQLKAFVSAALARHVLTQLHPGAALVAQQMLRRNASSSNNNKVGQHPYSPVLTGEASVGFLGNSFRLSPERTRDDGIPYHQRNGRLQQHSKAMSRVVDEYEQRLSQAREVQSQWKRATSGHRGVRSPTDRVLSPNPVDEVKLHSVCSRNHDLGREKSSHPAEIPYEYRDTVSSRVTSAGRHQRNLPDADRCDVHPQRLEELVQLRWDDDHLRRSHGVPATYQHWRDTTFTTVPVSPTSNQSTASGRQEFPRPPPPELPRALLPPHRLTRQAETLARQLELLPRPVGSALSRTSNNGPRCSSARTVSQGSQQRYNPEMVRRQLLKEVRQDV